MSRELSDFYRSLAADADGRALVVPEVLRRRADRRARVRVVGTALAAALLVGGASTGARLAFSQERGPMPPPAGTPAPTATAPESTPSPAYSPTSTTPSGPSPTPAATGSAPPRTPTSIPDRAFFTQPADTTAAAPYFTEGKVLPDLCGARLEERVVQRRTRALFYHLEANRPEAYVPDGSYRHTITIHRLGRADDWMADLRQAVRDCPEQEIAPGLVSRQRLLRGGDYGDEAVLFEMRSPARTEAGEPASGETVRLIRAIRVDDVVTVLWESGWEDTSSDRSHVDDYSRRAVRAIESWLDRLD